MQTPTVFETLYEIHYFLFLRRLLVELAPSAGRKLRMKKCSWLPSHVWGTTIDMWEKLAMRRGS